MDVVSSLREPDKLSWETFPNSKMPSVDSGLPLKFIISTVDF